MKNYGYCRVSTREQNTDRQLIAFRETGIPDSQIYIDKISGKDFNRPAFQELVEVMENGDALFITSLDRFSRNYADIKDQWRYLAKEKGVDIVVMNQPLLDTRRYKDLVGTLVSDIILEVFGFVAETERDRRILEGRRVIRINPCQQLAQEATT